MERRVLEERRHTAALASCPAPETPQTDLPAVPTPAAGAGSARGGGRPASALDTTGGAVLGAAGVADEAGEVGLGDGAAVRGMRNDAQGGPLPPPGGRMSEAFQAVRVSLARHVEAQTGGGPSRCGRVWPLALTAAWRWHARPGRKGATRAKPCAPWRAPGGQVTRPQRRNGRRRASRCGRRGRQAWPPCSRSWPRGGAVLRRGCLWGERPPIVQKTIGMWSAGSNVPTATSVACMAVATGGFDWCSTVRRGCWRLTRLGLTRARVRAMPLPPTVIAACRHASRRHSGVARSCGKRAPERTAMIGSQTLKNDTLTHPSL